MTGFVIGLMGWGLVIYWMIRQEVHASRSVLLEQLTHLTVRIAQLEEELRRTQR